MGSPNLFPLRWENFAWRLVSLALLFLFGSRIISQPVFAQDVRLELKERFVLGLSEEDSRNMFGHPVTVRFDGAGNIYVFDQLSMKIKIFSSKGEVLRTLGDRGSASGKFNSMTTGWVNKDGTVVVFDEFNTRVTTFSPSGAIQVTETSQDTILWVRDVVPYGPDYFALYRLSSTRSLVHRWNSTFTMLYEQFADVTDWPLADNPFITNLSYFQAGRIIMWQEDLILAPPVCGGHLLAYSVLEKTPSLAYRLHGMAQIAPPIVPIPEPQIDTTDMAVVLNHPKGRHAAVVNCWSIGLSIVEDEVLAHFTARQEGRDKIIFVELFDLNGNVIGSHKLDWLTDVENEDPYVPLFVYPGLDSGLFVIDYRGTVPLVRVLSADLQRDP